MSYYRILLIEDHGDFGRALELLLRWSGHECRICPDAESALAVVDEYQPHAVILDIGLPGASGLEVAQRLRARPKGGRLVIVGCSGYAFPEDRERGLSAGMDVYYTKPVIAGELIQAVVALVEKKTELVAEQPWVRPPAN